MTSDATSPDQIPSLHSSALAALERWCAGRLSLAVPAQLPDAVRAGPRGPARTALIADFADYCRTLDERLGAGNRFSALAFTLRAAWVAQQTAVDGWPELVEAVDLARDCVRLSTADIADREVVWALAATWAGAVDTLLDVAHGICAASFS